MGRKNITRKLPPVIDGGCVAVAEWRNSLISIAPTKGSKRPMTTIDMFRHASDAVSFEAGKIIFRKDDSGLVMYAVTEGEVEILAAGKVILSVGPGGIFGEMALIEEAPRSATAVAKTACKLVAIDKKRFTFLVQQTPFFALSVMRIMSERLRKQLE